MQSGFHAYPKLFTIQIGLWQKTIFNFLAGGQRIMAKTVQLASATHVEQGI
jgi:hypothetical protein